MISRNTALPATQTARFVTHWPNQRNVAVNVVEGGDASGNDATPIGKCVVRDLPPGLPAGTPVEVTFQYGQDGRLTVKARLPGLNKEATSQIERASGMTVETLRDWNQRLGSEDGLLLGARSRRRSPVPLAASEEPPPLPPLASRQEPLPPEDKPTPLSNMEEPPPITSEDEPPPLPPI